MFEKGNSPVQNVASQLIIEPKRCNYRLELFITHFEVLISNLAVDDFYFIDR